MVTGNSLRTRRGGDGPRALGSYPPILHRRKVDSEELQSKLTEALEARPEILEAYLFGSYARGDATDHSDIDVAVYVDLEQVKPTAFGYASTLGTDLIAATGQNAIDVVVLNEAPPLLYGRVLQEGARLLSRDLPATTARAAQALSRYCDFLPQLAKIDAALSRRWREGKLGQ